jgi:pimeloyl-ACP methyl ester carboxylesterase
MRGESDDALELAIRGVRVGAGAEGYDAIVLDTTRGDVELRHYAVAGATSAALFVGGAGGGWDTPGRGRLYPELCADMRAAGVGAVRVRYRRANDLPECALDVLAALAYLEDQGTRRAVLVGHSFGGAVVAQAAAHSEIVRALVPMSTQSYGVDAIAHVPAGCATLLVHGLADEVLPPTCSRYAYELAPEPKELRLFEHARHGLDEAADEIRVVVREWILRALGCSTRG